MNIVNVLEVNSRRHPEKEAIIYQNRKYTYDEFNKKINQLAHGLKDRGVSKGDKVALMMKNSDYFALAYYACAKIGAVLVPINFRLRSKELNYIITNSDTKHIIADTDFEEVILQAVGNQVQLQNLFSVPHAGNEAFQSVATIFSPNHENPEIEILGTDDLHIMYTSGTTGFPKGALFDHNRVKDVAIILNSSLGYHYQERLMNFLPLFHGAALLISMISGFYIGGTLVIYRDFNPKEILTDIGKYKITSFIAVPTMYDAFLQIPKQDDFDLSTMEKYLYGAAPMSEDLVRKCLDYFGSNQFYSLCGQTETGPTGIMLYPKDHEKYAGMTGKEALAYTSVDIVNEQGHSTKPGEIGELIIKAPTVMKEYYKNPIATAETIRDGWLYSGDLAVRDEGNYIKLVDRKKDLIISGGENVYSIEVENVLAMHPSIVDVAVIGTPDQKWGELVTAVVVLKAGEQISEKEIVEFTREHLAGYKVPKKVIFTESLPRNASGKLTKYQLREMISGVSTAF
ncbi:long-chain fatty acid--CoA ligase [Bacillus sp. AFS002410]|uniref:class I adenylate-forming enzyme family protein n=1 Tax=Bacillus sp. AFS002410 TaxID=2033481 RepID=UPI000BF0A69F|nr:long-chain-fatty-acid--CoA ligase [Bacillus sp. AFS002410]PEJ60849.1 long-chain fatty acid--CoA ligase [Bacillus sp. AFS002410]